MLWLWTFGIIPLALASNCLFFTTPETCNKYMDWGSCKWDSTANVCVPGPGLPPNTVGVADVPLNPATNPFKLSPGPSASSGEVSLSSDSNGQISITAKDLALPVANSSENSTKSSRSLLNNVLTRPNKHRNMFCTQSQDIGPCKKSITRWYWDKERRVCRSFTYGGCGGNSNNFERSEECIDAAMRHCLL
jgi:hypothetical protein